MYVNGGRSQRQPRGSDGDGTAVDFPALPAGGGTMEGGDRRLFSVERRNAGGAAGARFSAAAMSSSRRKQARKQQQRRTDGHDRGTVARSGDRVVSLGDDEEQQLLLAVKLSRRTEAGERELQRQHDALAMLADMFVPLVDEAVVESVFVDVHADVDAAIEALLQLCSVDDVSASLSVSLSHSVSSLHTSLLDGEPDAAAGDVFAAANSSGVYKDEFEFAGAQLEYGDGDSDSGSESEDEFELYTDWRVRSRLSMPDTALATGDAGGGASDNTGEYDECTAVNVVAARTGGDGDNTGGVGKAVASTTSAPTLASSEDDRIRFVASMFPEFSVRLVATIMHDHNGNVNGCVEVLMWMSAEKEDADAADDDDDDDDDEDRDDDGEIGGQYSNVERCSSAMSGVGVASTQHATASVSTEDVSRDNSIARIAARHPGVALDVIKFYLADNANDVEQAMAAITSATAVDRGQQLRAAPVVASQSRRDADLAALCATYPGIDSSLLRDVLRDCADLTSAIAQVAQLTGVSVAAASPTIEQPSASQLRHVRGASETSYGRRTPSSDERRHVERQQHMQQQQRGWRSRLRERHERQQREKAAFLTLGTPTVETQDAAYGVARANVIPTAASRGGGSGVVGESRSKRSLQQAQAERGTFEDTATRKRTIKNSRKAKGNGFSTVQSRRSRRNERKTQHGGGGSASNRSRPTDGGGGSGGGGRVDSGGLSAAELRARAKMYRLAAMRSKIHATQRYTQHGGGAYGVDAVRLGDNARLHTKRALEADRLASQLLFDAKNKYASTVHDGATFDLHGQKVHEALEIATRLMGEAHASGQRQVSFITGVGKHSVGGVSRIRVQLKHLLKSKGYRQQELRAGVITVTL